MNALVTAPGNTPVVAQVPIPLAGPNEIRIKVHSIALNPVDALYAITQQVDAPGRVIGSDVAGYIDQIGGQVPEGRWKIGDRVAGLLQGGVFFPLSSLAICGWSTHSAKATSANPRPGGFATYAILEADLAIRIPDDVSFDEAATLPLCSLTAAQALYNRLQLPTPFPFSEFQLSKPPTVEKPILLIYSASTSLGLYTLELARYLRTPSGNPFTVIATASPRNHEKLKALGADLVYDYNDTAWPDKVKKEYPQGIDYAVDCISEGPTTGVISQLFNNRPDTEKRIAVIRAVAWDKASVRSDVKALYGAVWEAWPRNRTKMPSPLHLRALTVAFYQWLSAGAAANPRKLPISPNPVRLMPGGLERVLVDGFALLGGGDMLSRKGEERKEEFMKPISGEKLSRSASQGGPQVNHGEAFYEGAHGFHINQQNNTVNHYAADAELSSLLNPVLDASYTRNRKLSPPDSTCLPGNRESLIKKIESWADSGILFKTQHVMWIHGYVGCGKSSLAQTVAERYARRGRLAASFFFFRGSENRSRATRFAATVASQLASAIPGVVPHLDKAVKAHPGILTTYSLDSQFEHLVYEPFRKASRRNILSGSLFRTPYLVIIDGLDECDDREEIAAFIEHMLQFFDENPRTPLRFLFTSRVEEHIRTRLDSDQVHLLNLIDHTSLDDVAAVATATFAMAAKHSRVIQTYGAWPSEEDRKKLVRHSGGSLIFMSTILKFLLLPNSDGLSPMERLPLALEISPGLDGLYIQTLRRSKGLPYFLEIITALVLFVRPPTILELAEALGIEAFEVVQVLVNLHSILHVPGDDNTQVTFCHISLRDFLLSEERAGSFFISQSCHDRVYRRIFVMCEIDSPCHKLVAAIVLLRRELSITAVAKLLGYEPSQVSPALRNVRPLLHVPSLHEEAPIVPCNVSLRSFLQTESRSGSACISPSYHEDLAYACFAAIVHPSNQEATRYARMPAPYDVNSIPLFREMFASVGKVRIVDIVLTIVFTLSDDPFDVSSTVSAYIDFLDESSRLPGALEHVNLIAQVLESFLQHSGQRSLAEIQPGIVDHLSQVSLWDPTPLECHTLARAHVGLLMLKAHGARPEFKDPKIVAHFEQLLELCSDSSPLFLSEFTKLVIKNAKGSLQIPMFHIRDRALASEPDDLLDDLYGCMLRHAERSVYFLDKFLSAAALLEAPFTLDQLSDLLGLKPRRIRSLLERLRGIFDLPPHNRDYVRVSPTFQSYLRNSGRAGRFFADPSSSRDFALRCLQRLHWPNMHDLSFFDSVTIQCAACWKASLVQLPVDLVSRSNQLATAVKLLGGYFSFNAVHVLLRTYLDRGHGYFGCAAFDPSERAVLISPYEDQQSWVLDTHLLICAKVLDVLDQHFRPLGPLLTAEELEGDGPVAQALYAYTKTTKRKRTGRKLSEAVHPA
ncbi:hypothetical protein NMY22_g11327 [Coprinellus aureogranulatus]|nr:hypothetical protein NMY22_g11327 [Coprinellus aureogranulatus]